MTREHFDTDDEGYRTSSGTDEASDSRLSRRAFTKALGAGAGAITLGAGASGTAAARPSEFVGTDGGQFTLGGDPYYWAGTNNFWIADPYADRATVDALLDAAAALGFDAVRTWAFCAGADGHCIQTGPYSYDEAGLEHLDYLVQAAGDRGLRLILPLINNWDAYGGMNQYVAWASDASSHDDFYRSQECRDMYRAYVETILTRTNSLTGVAYRDDPTIMLWELANEPRAESQSDGRLLQDWIVEMGNHVKSLDGNHLLSTGMEGFFDGGTGWQYDGSQGTDYVWNHQADPIDAATFHVYPEHWGEDPSWGTTWIEQHVTEDRFDVPVYCGEFGWSDGGQTDIYREWTDALDRTDAGGALVWELVTDGRENHDGFAIYQDDASTDVVGDYAATVDEKSGSDGGSRTVDDGIYRIENVNSGKVLDVRGVSADDGATLHQWAYGGGANQHWRADHLGDGQYRLVAQHSEKVADVAGWSTDDGGDLHQWEWLEQDNQRWYVDDLGDGEYRVRSVHSGKVMDVAGSSTDDGGNVHQWDWHGGANQRWRFVPVDDGGDGDSGGGETLSLEGSGYTIRGAGVDVWNRSDEFHYAYEMVSGDAVLEARVYEVERTHEWAKAGVMLRDHPAADASHAFVCLTPDHGAQFITRENWDDDSGSPGGDTGVSAPFHVRIERSGDTITGSVSETGDDWRELGSTTIEFTDPRIGLAVTSHEQGTLCEAAFDTVAGWADTRHEDWRNDDIGPVEVAGDTWTF